jgi:hypothetical protein
MSVKVTDNTKQINSNTKQRASVFLRSFADEVVSTSTPKTPKDTGDLRNNVLKQVLGLSGKIQWEMRYAIYQENKQYRNYTTAGTGPHFAEDSVKKTAKKTSQIAKRVGLMV